MKAQNSIRFLGGCNYCKKKFNCKATEWFTMLDWLGFIGIMNVVKCSNFEMDLRYRKKYDKDMRFKQVSK